MKGLNFLCTEQHFASLFRSRAAAEQEKGNIEYASGFASVGDAICNLSYGQRPSVYLPEVLRLLKNLGGSEYLNFEEHKAVQESAIFIEMQIEKLSNSIS